MEFTQITLGTESITFKDKVARESLNGVQGSLEKLNTDTHESMSEMKGTLTELNASTITTNESVAEMNTKLEGLNDLLDAINGESLHNDLCAIFDNINGEVI